MQNSKPPKNRIQAIIIGAIRFYFVVMVVILSPLLAARLVMTPAFLAFEYYRADFPPRCLWIYA